MNYVTVEQIRHHEDVGEYVSYGIECVEGYGCMLIEDISSEAARVNVLVQALNTWEIPARCFHDKVEEWLNH